MTITIDEFIPCLMCHGGPKPLFARPKSEEILRFDLLLVGLSPFLHRSIEDYITRYIYCIMIMYIYMYVCVCARVFNGHRCRRNITD